MSHVYVDDSGASQVEIGERAASTMLSRCEQAGGLETGGILVGSYSGDGVVAHVNEALGPPKGSRSTRTGFIRSDSGLRKTLRRRWSVQQYYLGEWHFHPEGRACPSPQDRHQLAEIGRDASYVCQRPILIVMGGERNDPRMGVWVLVDSELLRLRHVTKST